MIGWIEPQRYRSASKVDNQAKKSLGQSGSFTKEIFYIYCQSRAPTPTGTRNIMANPIIKISLGNNPRGQEEVISARGQAVTDTSKVNDIIRKFSSKYGEGDVKKYYPKTDVAVQIPL